MAKPNPVPTGARKSVLLLEPNCVPNKRHMQSDLKLQYEQRLHFYLIFSKTYWPLHFWLKVFFNSCLVIWVSSS